MHVRGFDWLLAGSTVALGLALIGAPFAVSPRVSSLYALHGTLEGAPVLTRWMLSAWFPPLLALVPTALGFVAWYGALHYVPANLIGPLQYVAPVAGIFLGWVVLHEPIGWAFAGGAALIFVGVWVATRKGETR